jgi:hypothetical protein
VDNSKNPTCGFLSGITDPLRKSASIQLPLDQTAVLLFRAQDTKSLSFKINQLEPLLFTVNDKIAEHSIMIQGLEALIATLKMRAVMKQDISNDLEFIKSNLKELKSSYMNISTLLSARKPHERVRVMRQIKSLMMRLEVEFNQLKDASLSMKVATSEEKATFLKSAIDMKYKKVILRQTEKIEAKAILQSIRESFSKLAQEWETYQIFGKKENDKVECSIFSALNEFEHLEQLAEVTDDSKKLDDMTSMELLYAYGVVAPLCRIAKRSNAVEINPWWIRVEYLSADVGDSASVLCALDGEYKLEDTSRKPISDVVLICNPKQPLPIKLFMQTKLYQALIGVTVARNPDIYMPDQRIAICCSALVTGIRQLANPLTCTKAHVKNVIYLVYTIRTRFPWLFQTQETSKETKEETKKEDDCESHKTMRFSGMIEKLIDALKNNECPSKFLTEADGDNIQSINQVLVAMLCCDQAAFLFRQTEKQNLVKLFGAILAEAISRETRGYLKSENAKKPQEILNITQDSCLKPLEDHLEEPKDLKFSDEYNLENTYKFTEKWIRPKKHHNGATDTKAVIAVFRFCRLLYTTINSMVQPETKSSKSKKISGGNTQDVHTRLFTILSDNDPSKIKQEEEIFTAIQDAYHSPLTWDGFLFDMKLTKTIREKQNSKFILQIQDDLYKQMTSALVLQAWFYTNSKERRNGVPLFYQDPHAFLSRCAALVRRQIYESQLAEKLKRLKLSECERRRIERETIERELADKFVLTHRGTPTVFTEEQVKVMNQTRSQTDQLELDPASKILRHHCCYRQCPLYLKTSLATEDDIKYDTRHGIFAHLRFLSRGRNKYIPGFHRDAVQLLLQFPLLTKQEFIAQRRAAITLVRELDEYHEGLLNDLYDELKGVLSVK